MAEIIENHLVHYICDKCGAGRMRSIEKGSGERYKSICSEPSCRYEHEMLRKYPYVLIDIAS